jgi:hypothetical protein
MRRNTSANYNPARHLRSDSAGFRFESQVRRTNTSSNSSWYSSGLTNCWSARVGDKVPTQAAAAAVLSSIVRSQENTR